MADTRIETAIAALDEAEALIHSDVPVYQVLPAVRAALRALRGDTIASIAHAVEAEAEKIVKVVEADVEKVVDGAEDAAKAVVKKKAPAPKKAAAPAADAADAADTDEPAAN